MKFVSRNSNLMVVLKPGLPGNHLSGTAPVTGIYVKFSNGMVDVKEESLIEKMLNHPGFNTDFISADTEGKQEDPYAYYRSETEPTHVVTEIKYGHAEKSVSSAKPAKMPPELEKLIKDEATRIAKSMISEMMPDLLKAASSTAKKEVVEEDKKEVVVEEDIKYPAKTVKKEDKR